MAFLAKLFAATVVVILTIGRSDVRATAAEKSINRVFLTSETSFAPDYARGRIVGLWFTDVGNDPVADFTIDSGHVRVRLQCFRMCPAGTSVVLQARGAGIVRSEGTDRPTAFVSVPIPPEVPWGIYRV